MAKSWQEGQRLALDPIEHPARTRSAPRVFDMSQSIAHPQRVGQGPAKPVDAGSIASAVCRGVVETKERPVHGGEQCAQAGEKGWRARYHFGQVAAAGDVTEEPNEPARPRAT